MFEDRIEDVMQQFELVSLDNRKALLLSTSQIHLNVKASQTVEH